MKKLFVSDLDGTLLSPDGTITDYTAETINALVKRGLHFTFATARSVYSAKPITEKLDINVPCILMNGVSVYDLKTGRYIRNEFIPKEVTQEIIESFERHNVPCFMYKINRDILSAHYTELTPAVMRSFAEERKNKYGKPFIHCERFSADCDIVYFTVTDDHEKLLPLEREIAGIDGASHAFYSDTYTDKWYLEVFSAKASKANGIKFLREEYGFDYVIAFGDNLNDLSMFEVSDYRVAVGNAAGQVKDTADFTAESNACDGVAKWLSDNFL